ncbi:MAG: 5,10-methylenetetrahydrofolate reductase [Chitinophagaceae bacterium]|nr:MAG: 5,10-methylenetetrahydrofolate reductase [Chitinophagaceae bacterium]
MNLKEKLLRKQNGLLFYSFAPPKSKTEENKVRALAEKHIAHFSGLDIDGIILYDIQDESTRTNEERIFPFMPTITPEVYTKTHLTGLDVPKIIYKSIANYTKEMFNDWLIENGDLEHVVFVGASSQQQIENTGFTLTDAYQLKRDSFQNIILGGVTIPERHAKKGDEHLRLKMKQQQGCTFFISQCVYNLSDTKNLLSDYYYDSIETGGEMSPIIFTLAPCGSLKTLEFMQWLGIQVPKWLYNDLKNSKDILQASIDTSINIASEILNYSSSKNIPIGFNIESVSIRKEEINAANELLNEVSKLVATDRSTLRNLINPQKIIQ